MKHLNLILILAFAWAFSNCSREKIEEKGFQVSRAIESSEDQQEEQPKGLNKDSLKFKTQPSTVLLTGIQHIRITPLFKVNTDKKNNTTFIGSNNFYSRYEDSEANTGNNWNSNIIPGIKSTYGYNMVNVSLYNIVENKQKTLFEKPVLIRTLYYPSPTKDTLNGMPVKRDYFMVSMHNEDTNKDGFINIRDLRRFYLFNINGEKQKALIPENYSVFKSEYDPDNDFMYVFTKLDTNNNGRQDESEPTHIFWIDLKNPTRSGLQY